MERHTIIGADLLAGHESTLMKVAAQIALTHHERWDGQGYPHGLAGEDIPLVGRIVSVCDVFDALISTRPYKPQWPWDESVREIDRLAGSAFDPQVVQAFHEALPAIREIVDRVASREHPDRGKPVPPVH